MFLCYYEQFTTFKM